MSRFLQEKETADESFRQEIDFEDAIRLPDGGSTCEIYRTRWQRREVFVKRLKEEFRTNPLYLDALDKEYEIGVSLKHPSLPDYREFHSYRLYRRGHSFRNDKKGRPVAHQREERCKVVPGTDRGDGLSPQA